MPANPVLAVHNDLLTAQFNYLGAQAEKPLYHTSDPAQSRMVLEPHAVPVHDARALEAPSLNRDGFQIVRQKLPALDYHSAADRDGPYLVLLQDLVRTALGASKVISDTSILRLPGKDAFQKPLVVVHSDYTPASARRLLEESWDQQKPQAEGLAETAELVAQAFNAPSQECRYKRVIALNAWRPISSPPHDYPLAVCQKSSLARSDIVVANFIEESLVGESYRGDLSLCRYNEGHRWYCFSDMSPDEVLLFLGFDFADDAPCGAMHSAFHDPGCPADAPGRSSVEVRMFAFFD